MPAGTGPKLATSYPEDMGTLPRPAPLSVSTKTVVQFQTLSNELEPFLAGSRRSVARLLRITGKAVVIGRGALFQAAQSRPAAAGRNGRLSRPPQKLRSKTGCPRRQPRKRAGRGQLSRPGGGAGALAGARLDRIAAPLYIPLPGGPGGPARRVVRWFSDDAKGVAKCAATDS